MDRWICIYSTDNDYILYVYKMAMYLSLAHVPAFVGLSEDTSGSGRPAASSSSLEACPISGWWADPIIMYKECSCRSICRLHWGLRLIFWQFSKNVCIDRYTSVIQSRIHPSRWSSSASNVSASASAGVKALAAERPSSVWEPKFKLNLPYRLETGSVGEGTSSDGVGTAATFCFSNSWCKKGVVNFWARSFWSHPMTGI